MARGTGSLLRRAGHLGDRKSTRLNSSHSQISYAVFCLKKKRIGLKIRQIREEYLALRSQVKAVIDFPEEDIDPATGQTLLNKLQNIREKIAARLHTADQ